MLDEALLRPGRLEVHVEIGLPDEQGRLQILKVGPHKTCSRSACQESQWSACLQNSPVTEQWYSIPWQAGMWTRGDVCHHAALACPRKAWNGMQHIMWGCRAL